MTVEAANDITLTHAWLLTTGLKTITAYFSLKTYTLETSNPISFLLSSNVFGSSLANCSRFSLNLSGGYSFELMVIKFNCLDKESLISLKLFNCSIVLEKSIPSDNA